MEIYVITKGEYEDYHIIGATTNYDKAKSVQKMFSDRYDRADVEIYNSEEMDAVSEGDRMWICKFDLNPLVCISAEVCINPDAIKHTEFYKNGLTVSTSANSLEEAIYKARIIAEEKTRSNGNTAN